MPNLITDLGVTGFNERCVGALLEVDQAILRVDGTLPRGDAVLCTRVASRLPTPGTMTTDVRVHRDVFSSYDIFKTPQLGYRNIGTNTVAYIRKRVERSHASGFRTDRLLVEVSPFSALFTQMTGTRHPEIAASAFAIKQLYWPTFNTVAQWDDLVKGEASALVLSGHWMVEPSVYGNTHSYDVFCDGMHIGTVDRLKQPLPETPKENIRLIEEILSS